CVVMFDPEQDPAQVDATWEFVQYMVSAEQQFQFHQATGYIPVNRKVYEMPEAQTWFAENPLYQKVVDCIHASNPNVQEPFDIINWEIDAVIKTHMLAFANGEESIEQCADGIVSECNQKLDDYHYAND
ncbi:MAG: extracellular solute-binding protein, partial [Aristaeellaceae bacterium]